jgi:hypothetical protein
MWRVRQFGNHWVVIKPNGVALTASGMGLPIDGSGPLAHALTAAAESGDLHPFTREGYSAAVLQLATEEHAARAGALRAAIEYVDDTPSPGWVADAAYEGVWTGDRRFIEPDALTWREPPMALMYQDETEVGHFGAVLAGWIESTTREGGTIVQRGQYDDNEAGYELRGVVNARGRFGVSSQKPTSSSRSACRSPRRTPARCTATCSRGARATPATPTSASRRPRRPPATRTSEPARSSPPQAPASRPA